MLKKTTIITLLIAYLLSACPSVLAFTFPEPDWGALLQERKNMVMPTEFELYAQAPLDSAPYYWEKYEPRAGTYIGTVADVNTEKLAPVGSYLSYLDGMGHPDFYYPANNMIREANVLTLAGWTINDLNTIDYDHIRQVLTTLNEYNKPILVRFANEMNCSPLGDDPIQYVNVFRTVADMIHEYPNLGVVWSPNDMGALDRPFEYYYPGDEYVDWVGISCYEIQYFMGSKNAEDQLTISFMTGDFAWATNKVKPFMDFLQKNNINKPVMISEGGVSTANDFGEDCQAWATPRLRNMLWYLVMKYPQIKMINYFNVNRQNELEKFDISNYPYAVEIFNEARNSGAYITEYGKDPEFVFQPAGKAGTLVAKNGKIPLYTLAYVAKQPEIGVNYFVDGIWKAYTTQIPYIWNMDIADLADGKHTLKISIPNNQKEYTFYKSGSCIRFGAEPDPEIVENAQQNGVTVTVNGAKIAFDQPPIIQDGRTLVPLRAIFEALGATVDWNGDTQTVTSTKDNTTITLTIGSNMLYVNGTPITLDVPAQILNGRTLVPVRAVAESFACTVGWDGDTQTVTITQ